MQGNTLLTLGGAALLAFLDGANAFENALDGLNDDLNRASDDLNYAGVQEALDRRMGCNNLQDYQCDVDTSSLRGALENSSCGCELNTGGYIIISILAVSVLLLLLGVKKNSDAAKLAAQPAPGGSYALDSYCGIISWVIGCWVLPCIACCPVDRRARYVAGAQQTTIFQTTTGAHPTKTEIMSRQASAAPSSMTITVPEGAAAGQTLTVQAPTGQTLSVQVPPGAAPGSQFVVSMPAPAPVVQAVAAQHVAQPVANAV